MAATPLIGFHGATEQFPPAELIDLAVAAERAGFDAFSASDHLHPWQTNQGHASHAWLLLSAVAARTERLIVGTSVTCPTYRYHPVEVAQAFASLGAMWSGRVFLGLGTGEALNEAPYGGWGPYGERAARLEEAVGLIRRLWTGAWTETEGGYYPVRGVRLFSLPPEPVPLYIAASGPKSAALAGRVADGWITDPRTARERDDVREAFERGARDAGRDPATLARVVELWCVAGDRAEALAFAPLWQFLAVASEVVDVAGPDNVERIAMERATPEQVVDGWTVSADPGDHVRAIEELASKGVTHVFVHSPQADQRRVIEFFGRDVLPALR